MKEMSIASRELVIYMENESRIYFNRIKPICANLKKKFGKGSYDSEKACKLWAYAVNDAAKMYCKEFGGVWNHCFTVEGRKEACRYFEEYYRENGFDA